MPGRSFTSPTGYRYGFNGKENDDKVKGIKGSQQDYGMRIYDPRLGRFLSVDPMTASFPWYTPYQFAGNNPVQFVDLDGLEEAELTIPDGDSEIKIAISADIKLIPLLVSIGHNQIELAQKLEERIETKKNIAKTRSEQADILYTAAATIDVWNIIPGSGTIIRRLFGVSPDGLEALAAKKLEEVDELNEQIEQDEMALADANSTVFAVASAIGYIYERIDKSGKLKPYVGQVKNILRYFQRQSEHARKNPNSRFKFKIIDKGTPGQDLDKKEQKQLDKRGGPTNKSNPKGGTSNKRNVIRKGGRK